MTRFPRRFVALPPALLLALSLGCGGSSVSSPDEASPDDEFAQAAPGGKADSTYGACEVREAVAWVNDPAVSVQTLRDAGVHTRAARNIVAHRDGPDATPATDDDDYFDDAPELDDVSWVGPVAFRQLTAAVAPRCAHAPEASVIFSPQRYDDSHLAKVVQLIDGAQHSVDVAMYSFRDNHILDALHRASSRGVSVRFLFNSANEDHKDPQGTTSAALEDMGIDVRYVNKIMHHKFALVDGPREDTAAAATATLVTGSGNWSYSAGTKYDENTVVVRYSTELAMRFQKEFNLLWDNSRDLAWSDAITPVHAKTITDWMIPNAPSIDAVFTSSNFKIRQSATYGPTFSVISGKDTVADRLVQLIQGATKSIHIASGHLRSRAVSEALLAKHAAHPEMDIQVYLDGQEYISSWYANKQQKDLDSCLASAGDSVSKQQKCRDKGFYYSYPVKEAGIPLKFKYSCYRWDYHYAVQMHDKYSIFDGHIVSSGSYNLSDNAEHNTMENLIIYQGGPFAPIADQFENNFAQMWTTGEEHGNYDYLVNLIENTDKPIPLVFKPMALTWDQITHLKSLIRANCPDIDSDEFRKNPTKHTTCAR